ncbi:MAG TPA: hypothetical protein VN513_04060 [Gemmatimonadales bacterium]|nr:hypothetical protein [Gemmatimonadales bacterium]
MKTLAFVLLAALAVACRNDRTLPPGPSFVIEDGNHHGNPFFYWLPPVVKQQAPDGQTFSSQLAPIITITNLCTGNVIRSILDVEVGNGQYQANWHTADDYLDTACTYRLAVSVGAHQLGLADMDVVDNGRELKNVNSDEYIPLLDDRTLPIKFFVGVGSLCDPGVSDCGEGVAQPGVSTTIVTASGRAGLLVPAGAVSEGVAIAIQSVDNAAGNVCIPGLLNQYAGTTTQNACYEFRASPTSGTGDLGHFTFNSNVTVGICPPVNAMQESHAVLDLLQIYRFDDLGGGNTLTQALQNVSAPFLACDPNHDDTFIETIGRALLKLVGPRPLYASATSVAFDLGSGGSTDGFSRFAWALPVGGMLNFETNPDQVPIAPGAVINNAYSRIGVTLSRTSGVLGALCPGTAVYANSLDGSNNTVSLCPQGTAPAFSALSGMVVARFTVPVARVCIDARPIVGPPPLLGPVPDAAFLEGLASDGSVLSRITAKATPQAQSLCINQSGVAAVRFAGIGSTLTRFDNLTFSRIPSP